jgi:hypothetical protein
MPFFHKIGPNTVRFSHVPSYNPYYYHYNNPVVIPYQMLANPLVHQYDYSDQIFYRNGISQSVDNETESSSDENDFNTTLNWFEEKQRMHEPTTGMINPSK